MALVAAAAAVVVWGSDLLRCGSDAAGVVGVAAAAPCRCADAAAAALPADPDAGLS